MIGQNDMMTQVFGETNVLNTKVNESLSITLSASTISNLTCEAFILNQTVFLSSPFAGTGLLDWADGEFQSWYNHNRKFLFLLFLIFFFKPASLT